MKLNRGINTLYLIYKVLCHVVLPEICTGSFFVGEEHFCVVGSASTADVELTFTALLILVSLSILRVSLSPLRGSLSPYCSSIYIFTFN